MNRIRHFFRYKLPAWVLFGLLSCQEKDSPLNGGREIDFSQLTPAVTARGAALGSVFTRVVGPAGGQVQSPDGQISIDIPAGALSVNTPIGIQSITNQAPLGTGNAYRLTPEGDIFSKPVTITMKYRKDLPAPFVWIVTQYSNGIWLGDRNSTPDETTGTVSAQTLHFSDWAVGRLIDLRLSPEKATVKVKESLKLNVTGFYARTDEDLTPLIPIHAPDDEDLAAIPDLSEAGKLLVKLNKYSELQFKEWRLDALKAPVSGNSGRLETAGSSATYTAPDHAPEPDEVSVSVSIQAKDKKGGNSALSIITPVRIVENEHFLTLYLDGKKIEYIPSGNGVKPIEQGLGSVSLRVRDNELHLVGQYDTRPEYSNIIELHINNDRIFEGTKLYQRDKSRTPYTTLTFTPTDRVLPQFINESAIVTNNPNAGCFHSPIPIPVELSLHKTTQNGYDYFEGGFSCKIYYVSTAECLQPEEHTLKGVFHLKGY